jgi:uncharacterized membrane protein
VSQSFPPPSTSRVEAFSDGFIAIAITLLVLQVQVPEAPRGKLVSMVAAQWPSYVGYVVTFLTIGIIWINHHAAFDRVTTVDRNLLFLNLVLLAAIAFVPFPTAVLAHYLQKGRDAGIAAALYSVNMMAIAGSFALIWIYLARHGDLLAPGFTPDRARLAVRRAGLGTVAYAASIAVAVVAPAACLPIYAAVALYFVAPGRHTRLGLPSSPT